MSRHIIPLMYGSLLMSCLTPLAQTAQPNVLLIVSDDQGYADVGFHGCKDIPTPHLDRLAREGVRCSNGYVSHPFCSPTRAGLMTGRYQHRFGHENNPFFDSGDEKEGLPLSETLLPAVLQKAGYTTGWIGKWHLGAAPGFHPMKRGFQETFGFLGGGHRYLHWTRNPKQEYTIDIERNGEPVEVKEHLTVRFGQEAAAFVTRHAGQPWFLYLAFNAPHTPNEPTPERFARFQSIADPKRRSYAAQVSLMDDAIGETLAALEKTGQKDNTLVFFFSDNGGPVRTNGSRNDPLRGAKGEVYEGGVRVPYLVRWPAQLEAGTVYAQPVSSLDVFATAVMQAGLAMPTDKIYDGVDLIPFLSGKNPGAPHDRLFWRTASRAWAIREGHAKLVRWGKNADELYDLSKDLSETTDVAADRAGDVKDMAAAIDAWDAQLIPPAFPGAGAHKRPVKKAP